MILKTIREKRNIKQKDIANTLGITQAAYSNYETGIREPDYKTLIKIADFFDVTTDELLEHKKKDNQLASITLTENQKLAVNEILRLNELNLILAISYCKGLYATQTEV